MINHVEIISRIIFSCLIKKITKFVNSLGRENFSRYGSYLDYFNECIIILGSNLRNLCMPYDSFTSRYNIITDNV